MSGLDHVSQGTTKLEVLAVPRILLVAQSVGWACSRDAIGTCWLSVRCVPLCPEGIIAMRARVKLGPWRVDEDWRA